MDKMDKMAVNTFANDEEANAHIFQHELKDGARYIVRKSKSPGVTRIDSLDRYRVLFEDEGRQSVPLPFDGIPFIVLSSDIRECQYGSVRQMPENNVEGDHFYSEKKRRHIQNTKKMNCPAVIKLRRIIKFPQYKIQGANTKWNRIKMTKKLKAEFGVETKQEYVVKIQYMGLHENHLTGKLSGYGKRLDGRVIENIKNLAGVGVTNVSEVQRRCEEFTEKFIPAEHDKTDRRFHPSRKDVYNHIYNSLSGTRSSNSDQLNVAALVDEWRQHAGKGNNVFYRAMSETDQMLLLVQTDFQKHLLNKYGQEICLLDSTYNTTKYSIPLFFVCVKTNNGYQVAALFMTARETTASIKEAIQILATWNPCWKPEHWMVDFDQREISALETVFPETQVLLCSFHTQQAWQRWLGAKKNGVHHQKEIILNQMRIIAQSKTEELFHQELKRLKEMDVYKTASKFRNWIDRQWVPECRRWVYCYRKLLFNISVNTSNGIERQHRLLKENYLKQHGFGGTFTSLLTILLRKFIPAMEEKYVKSNISSLKKYRKYSEHTPKFLEEKPQPFIKHCLQRMPPKSETIDKDQIQINEESEFLQFSVSTNSGKSYTVDYEHNIPCCSCPDFERSHWPCKHILAVFEHYPQHGWESLNPLYTCQPCFNLDVDKITSMNKKMSVVETKVPDLLPNEDGKKTAEYHEETKEPDTTSVRKTCIELIKNVQNNLYATENIDVLCHVKENLNEIDIYLNEETPKLCGMPVRVKRKRSNVNSHQPKKAFKIAKANEEINKVDIDITNESEMPDNALNSDLIPFIEVVEEIWRSRRHQLYQIGKIGPYIITAESIKFIQTTLSDEVIDSYLHMICQSKNVLHISCVVMTSIFSDIREVTSLLRKEDFSRYQYCIGAINEGGCHWTLMIICPSERKLIYMNPLGETDAQMQQMLQLWYAFLHARHTAGVEEIMTDGWLIESPAHAKQSDGLSCGVYVLKLAESFLNRTSLQWYWTSENLLEIRKEIAATLLCAGDINLKATSSIDNSSCHAEEASVGDNMDSKIASSDQDEVTNLKARSSIENTSSHEKALLGENMDSTNASSNKGEVIAVVKRIPRRRKEKRKLSSFVYADLKKKKRNLYCICQKPYDKQKFMIQCDKCEEWFHLDCLGIGEADVPKEEESFFCKTCRE